MKLSNSILKQLDQFDYSTNRGLLDTNETPLYVVKNNKVDAILIEAGFISMIRIYITLKIIQKILRQPLPKASKKV